MEGITGDIVHLNATNPRHYGTVPARKAPGDFMSAFSDAVKNAVSDVNDLQVRADGLATQYMHAPDTVDVHDVMIAAQKAQLSLDFTRALLQKAVQAYQNISNLR